MSSKVERRGFLKGAFALLGAAVTAAVGIPVAVAFLKGRRTVFGGDGPSEFGKLDDLPIGEPRKVDVIAERTDAWDRSDAKPIGSVWLVRRDDDHVDAYSGACPHLGCAVNYDGTKKQFTCPCHESAFDPSDGHRVAGPSPRGLDPLPVELKEGKVLVTWLQFIQGLATRRRA